MDPTLIYGAVTAVDQTHRQFTTGRRPSAHAAPAATRPWRRGTASMLHRLADRLEPAHR
jgi:hypothetical protein